jgi:hypothetical protein
MERYCHRGQAILGNVQRIPGIHQMLQELEKARTGVFVGQEIDLYKLYRVVGKQGRCSEVCVFKNLMHSYMALYTLN